MWRDPMNIWLGDSSHAQLGLEIFKFVSTRENPCVDDMTMAKTHASVRMLNITSKS
jgi:hypothetical protein